MREMGRIFKTALDFQLFLNFSQFSYTRFSASTLYISLFNFMTYIFLTSTAYMFTNKQRQEERTGRFGTPRVQYLQVPFLNLIFLFQLKQNIFINFIISLL